MLTIGVERGEVSGCRHAVGVLAKSAQVGRQTKRRQIGSWDWRDARKNFWRDATVDRKRRRFGHGLAEQRGHPLLGYRKSPRLRAS